MAVAVVVVYVEGSAAGRAVAGAGRHVGGAAVAAHLHLGALVAVTLVPAGAQEESPAGAVHRGAVAGRRGIVCGHRSVVGGGGGVIGGDGRVAGRPVPLAHAALGLGLVAAAGAARQETHHVEEAAAGAARAHGGGGVAGDGGGVGGRAVAVHRGRAVAVGGGVVADGGAVAARGDHHLGLLVAVQSVAAVAAGEDCGDDPPQQPQRGLCLCLWLRLRVGVAGDQQQDDCTPYLGQDTSAALGVDITVR